MTELSGDLDALLQGLNDPQREAVTYGEGPLLIIAGAGSGKTRVLTHRIAYLVGTDAAKANEILAITFTNKAAGEMRDRAELLVGRRVRSMWVMTFHSACARMLRAEAPRLGYTRQFTIYDTADSRRLIKRCLDELGIDTKRFTPASIGSQISDAKNKLRDADAYGKLVGSYFEQTVADVYRSYERELHRANAMDFDDLLVRAVNVLELFPEVRERYANGFRHVLVDEYQDTNHAQYRWLQLLAGEHRNLTVVGDDAQCLIEGTLVTMADGSRLPIERVRVGDEVLSGYGDGEFGGSQVSRVHRSLAADGVEITMRSGRRLVSTAEHTHFAGRDPHRVEKHAYRAGFSTRSGGGAVLVAPGVANLGRDGGALAMIEAASVRPGMVMFDEDGGYDAVMSARPVALDRPVYDIDVEGTHNFIADGIVTHNSIYGFRGADITNLLEFEDTFPDAHVVKLEQNYRSTQTILDAANAVIANNRGQKPKSLWTDIGQGDPIKIREVDDEHAEARFVTGEIQRLVDEGTSRAEVAVFYRTNSQSRVLEDTLVRAEIAYQVIGGTKFYERAEIKDALAYLIVLVNHQDIGSFTRIVNSPRRGIGNTTISRLLAYSNTSGETVWELAAAPEDVPGLGRGRDQVAAPVHGDDGGACRTSGRPDPDLDPAQRAADRDRLSGDARERAHDRGAGSDREPPGARQRRRRVRREHRGAVAGGVPAAAGARRRRRRAGRRRGPGDADDAAQRQGARVPDRVHHRLRGGGLPALAGAGRRRPGGGASALLRRDHPRRTRSVSDLGPVADDVRDPQFRRPEPLPGRDPGAADRSREPAAARLSRRPGPRDLVGHDTRAQLERRDGMGRWRRWRGRRSPRA